MYVGQRDAIFHHEKHCWSSAAIPAGIHCTGLLKNNSVTVMLQNICPTFPLDSSTAALNVSFIFIEIHTTPTGSGPVPPVLTHCLMTSCSLVFDYYSFSSQIFVFFFINTLKYQPDIQYTA